MNSELVGVAPITHLGVIRVQGEDAAKFLHGQLTQDFALLGRSEARLAGFCSAKGRLQASFVGFKAAADEILLVCSQDLLPATLKRLSMFVLRAKAKLSDASAEFVLQGLVGQAAQTTPLAADAATWAHAQEGQRHWIQLPPALGLARVLTLGSVAGPVADGPALATELWRWLEVRAGVATVSVPVIDAFVPQMLNYESVGGVNFKKGCYPGQEVVARSQFRGTLKRRAYVAHSDAEPVVAQEVFHDSDPDQPCGTVVQVAAAPDGGFDAIVSMQTTAAEGGSLHLGRANGPGLTLHALPYSLLADI